MDKIEFLGIDDFDFSPEALHERNKVPEKLIAIDIIFPSRKQFRLEINFPKIRTSRKNTSIRTTFIINAGSIDDTCYNCGEYGHY